MDDGPANETLEQRALRMVLWGEPESDVMDQLQSHGANPEEAARLYAAAFEERVRTIRSDHWPTFWKGGLSMLAGSASWWLAAWRKAHGKPDLALLIPLYLAIRPAIGFGFFYFYSRTRRPAAGPLKAGLALRRPR